MTPKFFFHDEDKPAYLHSQVCRPRSGKGAHDFIRTGGVFTSIAIMYRMQAVPLHGVDERVPNTCDWFLWIEVLAAGGEYGYVEGVYARYRKRRGSISDPLSPRYQNFSESIFLTLAITESRYPHLVGDCQFARTVQLQQKGVVLLLREERKLARRYLLAAMSSGLLAAWKSPFWLLLTLMPDNWLETGKQLRKKLRSTVIRYRLN